MQAARERRRAEVRRPAVHVQPRIGRALLPLSLPAAAVVARGHAELRGDRDPGRGDGRDWESAGSRSHQDHRRVARQVVSLFLSSNWREKGGLKKGKVERALTICFVRGLSGQMNSRPCWSTPRWVYRLSAASSSGSAALPALRVGLRVTR